MKDKTAGGREIVLKRTRDGYRSSLRLQQRVAHLQELIQQEQQAIHEKTAQQLLLANAILLHRVTHQFMHPLYQEWSQAEDPTSSAYATTTTGHDPRRLSRLPLVQSNPNWEVLLQLATSSSYVMRRLLAVTPEQVRALANFGVQDAWQLTRECVTGVIMLSELLRSARYPKGLLMPAGHQPAAAQTPAAGSGQPPAGASVTDGVTVSGNPSTAAAVDDDETVSAAQQLLSRLEQYQALINKMSISVSVLMALQPTVLLGLAAMDLETGKQGSPPPGHFRHAANRLHLTSSQIAELLRIRHLSTRMMGQVRLTGLQLVDQMADSFSVLASMSEAATTLASIISTGHQASASAQQQLQQQQQSDEASKQQVESNVREVQQQQQQQQQQQLRGKADDDDEEEEEKEGSLEGLMLEQLMQRHVRNLGDVVMVQATWVTNVLTPWQHGVYAAACWPFQASMGALVELAPMLTPDDAPPLQINAAVSREAAAAAALGAELGYVGTQQSMQQRHDAMDVHLAWILQELGLLQHE